MIRIGLNSRDKQKTIDTFLAEREIKKIFCFYFKKFPVKYKTDCEIEYIEYSDIEMYKYFYRLLEEINSSSLLVFDGIMRTQNRRELKYNCAHHYCNQTPHKIVFEYLPFIEQKDDFMILLDLVNKNNYKGKAFDYIYLQQEDILIKSVNIKIEPVLIDTTKQDIERYEKKKESLFANLGNKDPDTIPNALQLLAGDIKRKHIEPDTLYIARNKRFKLDNIYSYSDEIQKSDYTVIDTHYRRLDFIDFLKKSGMTKLKYLCTDLPIDNYVLTELTKWKARIDAIYVQASIYK